MEKVLYDDMYRLERQHWWFQARREIITGVVSSALPKGAAILDVGCGTGFVMEGLQQDFTVYGIDHAAVAVDYCTARGLKRVHQGMLGQETFGGQRFDLIMFLDMIEHIDNDYDTLVTAAQYLKPGGRILITVPAYRFLWSAHDEIHHHKRRYRRSELDALVRRAGYAPAMLSYYNTLLFPLIAAARLLGKLTGRRNASDAEQPGTLLNNTLYTLFAAEKHLLPFVRFPFGVSLMCLAERAATPPLSSQVARVAQPAQPVQSLQPVQTS